MNSVIMGHHVCFLHLQRGRALGVARPADEVASKRSIHVRQKQELFTKS